MPRLTQALERAGVIPRQNADDVPTGFLSEDGIRQPEPQLQNLDEAAEEADARQVTVQAPPVVEVPPTMHEPPARPLVAAIRCPSCERVQGVRTQVRGLSERTLLSLMRIRSYECSFCGRRFRRFNVEGAEPATEQGAVEAFSTFLPPNDHRDFGELIHDIAQAEQEQRTHGRDLQ